MTLQIEYQSPPLVEKSTKMLTEIMFCPLRRNEDWHVVACVYSHNHTAWLVLVSHYLEEITISNYIPRLIVGKEERKEEGYNLSD